MVGTTDAVDGDELPFAIGDIAILASQIYYSYDDRRASLQPNGVMMVLLLNPHFYKNLHFNNPIPGILMTIGVTGVRKYLTMYKRFLWCLFLKQYQ